MKIKLRLLLFAAMSVFPWFLKRHLYRFAFGAKIAENVRVGFGTVLCFDQLSLEAGARIGSFNFIRVSQLSMGKRARIGSFTRIECHTVTLGSASTIASWVSILADHRDSRSVFEMGSESWVFDYCYVNPARPIKLGRNVGVGGGSYLFAHGLWLSKLDGYPVAFAPITIGNDVWLPWGCFIMPGVEIGAGTVVGARALVTKSLPAGVLAAGTPAKIIRETVATPLSIAAKNEALLDCTREFARYIGREVSVEERDGWLHCRIGNDLLMMLATVIHPTVFPEVQKAELCVVHSEYRDAVAHHSRVYSLKTYQTCPYDSIGGLQKRWLSHLRLIGVRYYPIDEVQVES